MSEFTNEIREDLLKEAEKKTVSSIPVKASPEKRCYTVDEIQAILGICRKNTYALLKKKEFRWFKVGSTYRISKKSFDEWLDSGI